MTLIVWTLVLCVLMYGPVTEACPSGCGCGRSDSCNGTYVNCGGTGLTEVPTNIPTDTCDLILYGNEITVIPDNAFNSLQNLTYLYLNGNQITTIPDNAFNGLPNLQTLSLYSNKITTIPDNAFNGMPNLKRLDIRGNQITVLDKRFFKDLPKLKKIEVEENPLHCDCILAEFVSFAKAKNLTLKYNKEPKCSTPGNLTGVMIKDLSLEEMGCYLTTFTKEDLTTATTTLLETSDVPEIETVKVEKGLPVITIAYIITVPGLLILCFGVNFISYKWGMKKGQKKERRRYLLRSQENPQAVDYQHYFNDDDDMKLRSLRTRGYPVPSAANEFQDPSHDYADYDEIKDQKFQDMLAEERGYSTAEFESRNRPLPPIKADDDDYTVHEDDRSPEQKHGNTSNGSSSPPGNGGYLSPLQEEKEAEERLVSSNSDSSSNKSEKSEKSRKYQNEPPRESSSQPITPYDLIKNTEDSKEHQYIKLRTNSS